jgi:deazaflavin-dependent oxidoreductase (nitroreductase family)
VDERIAGALARGHLIDITTTGRRTGQARRVELVFHNIDGRVIISGMPRANRKRAWLLNLEDDPHLTFHLKGAVTADLPAMARVITDPTDRRAIADWITTNAWRDYDVDAVAAHSPMIEVDFLELAA